MTATITKTKSRLRSIRNTNTKARNPKSASDRERHFQIIRVFSDGREEVGWWAMRETETKAILRMHRKLRRPTDPTLDAREITDLLPDMTSG